MLFSLSSEHSLIRFIVVTGLRQPCGMGRAVKDYYAVMKSHHRFWWVIHPPLTAENRVCGASKSRELRALWNFMRQKGEKLAPERRLCSWLHVSKSSLACRIFYHMCIATWHCFNWSSVFFSLKVIHVPGVMLTLVSTSPTDNCKTNFLWSQVDASTTTLTQPLWLKLKSLIKAVF